MNGEAKHLHNLLSALFKAHPWHGVSVGKNAPDEINTYIEIVPNDTIKYELDKETGLLRVDRPQAYSNICPTLYGLVPQTLCGDSVAALARKYSGQEGIVGDDDPLDICVLTERQVTHGDILLTAIPIGGFRMLDGGEADDKIVAILKGDSAFGKWKDISDCPPAMIDRLKHYFLTYKNAPGIESDKPICEIVEVYGREAALEVIRCARKDYLDRYGDLDSALLNALRR